MRKIIRNSRCARAFALIELLVAISIFAVIVTVVYTTLYTSLKAYYRTQAELRLQQEVHRVCDQWMKELRNCYAEIFLNGEEEEVNFIGTDTMMTFFTTRHIYRDESMQSALARVSYRYEDGALYKKIQLDDQAFLDPESFEYELLFSDLTACSFRYAYLQEGESPNTYTVVWESEWQPQELSSGPLLPAAIEISFVRHDEERKLDVHVRRYALIAQGTLTPLESE